MKSKSIIYILVAVLIIAGIWSFITQKGSGTILEAIKVIRGNNVGSIIYQADVDNGVVVFYENNVGDGDDAYTINAEFIRHNLLGWKWVYGGGFSGCSGQYLPSIKGTPFPMIFGEAKNSDIVQIKILDKEHDETKTVDIVGTGEYRIWYVFIDESAGPNFEITGLSATGEIVESVNFNATNLSF